MKHYIKAARLRTLPLSVSGIIVGSAAGINEAGNSETYTFFFESPVFWLAMLTTTGFQILSNFANDYGDGIKGTDDHRKGEARMVSSGIISPSQMKRAIWITTLFTLLLALLLIYTAFGKDHFGYSLLFSGLGLASIAAAIKYTVGKSAYGYSGFGDLFVFLFFGLLAVCGTYFLFTRTLNFHIFLPAFTTGLLSTAVLNLNNMRDRVNDAKAGKNTIVVKTGITFARYYHCYLIAASFLFALLHVVIHYKTPYQLLFILAYIPLIRHLIFVMNNKEEENLDGELKKVALSTFLFAILFALGTTVLYI